MSSSVVAQITSNLNASHSIAKTLILCFLLLVISQPLLAGNYLDELAVEAEATASVSKKSQLSSSDKQQMQKMESLLKEQKPSTYRYYVKLTKRNKVRAFEQFADDQSDSKKRLSHLQKKVMDLYFEQ